MENISAVIITKNEARNIAKCLDSLSFANEIVVLDTGSEDDTLDICRKRGCKVFCTTWEGFGKAKKKAVELASNDWILSIDADEVLSSELQEEIRALADLGFTNRAFRLKRRSFYLGRMIRFCGWQKDAPLRLFNRLHGTFNEKEVHESVITPVPKIVLLNYMLHYTYPTLESHFSKMRLYGELGAKTERGRGKISDPVSPYLRAGLKFVKMYFIKLGFLDGYHGFLLCKNSAWGIWYKYHLLWKQSS